MSTSDSNGTRFPSIENPKFLLQIHQFFVDHSLRFFKIEFYVAIVGLIVTVFHLTVLTRKSLMVSSVISVMIGIAICDWVSMAVVVGVQHILMSFFRNECTPPSSYSTYYTFYILLSVRDAFIRCSTWLSVLMSLVRLVSVKRKSDFRFKSVRFGFFSFGICFAISSVVSALKYLRTKLVETGRWAPATGCEIRASEQGPWILYEQQASDFFSNVFLRIFNFVNGFTSRMLPCILLPILSILLVIEIRKARKKMASTSSLVRKRTEKTTTLVILMAVTFFIANLPSGVFTFFQVVYTDIGFLKLSVFVDRFCNGLLTVNATVHCLICFVVSTDYRRTAKRILRIGPKKQVSSVL